MDHRGHFTSKLPKSHPKLCNIDFVSKSGFAGCLTLFDPLMDSPLSSLVEQNFQAEVLKVSTRYMYNLVISIQSFFKTLTIVSRLQYAVFGTSRGFGFNSPY